MRAKRTASEHERTGVKKDFLSRAREGEREKCLENRPDIAWVRGIRVEGTGKTGHQTRLVLLSGPSTGGPVTLTCLSRSFPSLVPCVTRKGLLGVMLVRE